MDALPASIGIIGGMGPWVDSVLLRKLLECQTELGMRRDQDAIPTLLAQYAQLIEDRTEYLASTGLENPAVNVARVGRMLASSGAVVLGIPCNTFHAPAIFGRFEEELADLSVSIVHMIRATLADVRARRIGILSSNGTYLHRIYSGPISDSGREAITLPRERQDEVHGAILRIKSGTESRQGYPKAKAMLAGAARRLAGMGAEVVILGCTEIPLALEQRDAPEIPLHDPMDSLARALVQSFGAEATRSAALP